MASLGKSTSPIGGVYRATASGSIANGKACLINSNGTVTQAAAVAGGTFNLGYYTTIYQYTLATPFDTSATTSGTYAAANSASAAKAYGHLSASSGNYSAAHNWSSDGTKFFTVDSNGSSSKIHEFTATTGFNVTTLSYVDAYTIGGKEANPRAMDFKTDGTEVYVCGRSNSNVHQYTLSTAWDISTASFTRTFDTTQDDLQHGLRFKPDGTKMYVTDRTDDEVHQFTLSTAWDISSASFDSVSLDVSSYDALLRDVVFNDDGTVVFIAGGSGTSIIDYTLSTAYNLSTASFRSETAVPITPHGISFTPGGNCNNNNFIGISEGAYTNGQTAKIKVIGAIDTNQSGLTPNALCYTNDAGTIVSTAGGATVGLALSPTTVLIKGPYDMLFD